MSSKQTNELTVAGRVMDRKGKPVVGARVTGWDAWDRPCMTQADHQGQFTLQVSLDSFWLPPELIGIRDGITRIRAEARGFLRNEFTVLLEPIALNHDFVLETGRSVQVKVLNRDRRPVAGATVQVQGGPGGAGGMSEMLLMPGVADAAGEARLSGLSPGSVSATASARGYLPQHFQIPPVHGQRLIEDRYPDVVNALLTGSSDGEEALPINVDPVEVLLEPAPIIRGRVIDRETRQTLSHAHVEAVSEHGVAETVRRGVPASVRNKPVRVQEPFEVPAPYRGTMVLVAFVEGYQVGVSPIFKVEERDVQVDIELDPLSWIRGRVVDAAGVPVVGAQVARSSSGHRITWRPGGLVALNVGRSGSPEMTITDGLGRFALAIDKDWTSFLGPVGPYFHPFAFGRRPTAPCIAVAHASGYAEIAESSLLRESLIELRPWARVIAQVFVRGRPQAGVPVALNRTSPSTDWNMVPFTAVTDEAGEHSFERVPAGEYSLFLLRDADPLKADPPLARAECPVHAGECARVVLGEATSLIDRNDLYRVEGQICIAPKRQRKDWNLNVQASVNRLSGIDDHSLPPLSGGLETSSIKLLRRWHIQRLRSGLEPIGPSIPLEVQPDGTFVVEEAPPGVYELKFGYAPARSYSWDRDLFVVFPPGKAAPRAERRGPRNARTIGAYAGDGAMVQDDGSLMLNQRIQSVGTFRYHVGPGREKGDRAPDFEIRAHDGRPFRLSRERGRFILLEFWPSVPECWESSWRQLEELRRHFGSGGSLCYALVCVPFPWSFRSFAAFLRQKEAGWLDYACSLRRPSPWKVWRALRTGKGESLYGSIGEDYGLESPAQTYLIDAEGFIRLALNSVGCSANFIKAAMATMSCARRSV